MTKSELITNLAETLGEGTILGTEVLVSNSVLNSMNVNQYSIDGFSVGKSEKNRFDIAQGVKFTFYVYDEGGPSEKAYFHASDPINLNKKDVSTTTGTLEDVSKIFNSLEIRRRVEVATAKAANDILNESPSTQNHLERELLAFSILTNVDQYTEVFSWFVALNPTIQSAGGEATDNDIQYVVNSNLDKVALSGFGA
jgi:hypothetical protein